MYVIGHKYHGSDLIHFVRDEYQTSPPGWHEYPIKQFKNEWNALEKAKEHAQKNPLNKYFVMKAVYEISIPIDPPAVKRL